MEVEITVNGAPAAHDVEPRLLLVHYLREVLGLRATNVGCDTTSCGACTVLLDGESVKSCTVLAAQADGGSVTTLEGLADGDGDAAPGAGRVPRRARAAVRLLHAGHGDGGGRPAAARTRTTERGRVREGLEGNFCRCTGYHNIVRAVLAAAECGGGAVIPRRSTTPGPRAPADALAPARRARRRRQGAGRRALAAADDEAAAGRAGAADRHRPARRAALRPRWTATSWRSARSPGTPTWPTSRAGPGRGAAARARGRHWSATRRSATAARSAARSRTPTRPPTCPRPSSRWTARSCCAGPAGRGGCRRRSSSPAVLQTVTRPDELLVEVRVPRAARRRLGVPEVHPPGQRLGDRRPRPRSTGGSGWPTWPRPRCGPRPPRQALAGGASDGGRRGAGRPGHLAHRGHARRARTTAATSPGC